MHLFILRQQDHLYYISTTKNLKKRFDQIQDMNPFSLTLIYSIALNEDTHKLYESEIHNRLSECRVRGKWYRTDDILHVCKEVMSLDSSELLESTKTTIHAKQPNKSVGKYLPMKPCKNGHLSERYSSNDVCIECYKQYSKEWRQNNKEKYNQYHRQYNNYTIKHIKSDLNNPSEYLFHNNSNKRRLLLEATPKWADKLTIRNTYRECVDKFDKTQVKLNVDHIVPISHKQVCGLHVADNLQILSNSFKRKKGTFSQERESTSYFLWLKSRGL